MVKKEEEDLFFVGIKEPVLLRRELLLSTKNAIQFLKKNEELKDLRIQKIEEIMKFKDDLKEINVLMNSLKEKLPKAKLRVKAKVGTKKERKVKKKAKSIRKVSKLEKLEAELGDIESKLGRLR